MKKRLAAVLTLLLAALLCGCAAQPVSSQSFALDTVVTITIYAGGGEAEAQAALARVDECEALLSAHRQGSDIVFLNGADADENVLVSPLTADVLRAGLEIGEKTGGALDITLYAVSQLWDYKSENPQVPDEAAVRAALEKSGRGRVCVEGNSVCTGGTQLDLGAIAKGAVGDEVMACLKEQGVICALVNLGGNILTLGEKPTAVRGRLQWIRRSARAMPGASRWAAARPWRPPAAHSGILKRMAWFITIS